MPETRNWCFFCNFCSLLRPQEPFRWSMGSPGARSLGTTLTPGAPGPTTYPQDPGLHPFCGPERCALPLRFTLGCSGFQRHQGNLQLSSHFMRGSLCACPVRSSAERTLEAKMGTGSCLHFGDLMGWEGRQVWPLYHLPYWGLPS